MRVIKKYDLSEIARRIQDDRKSIDPVSFSGFGVENAQSILESGVDFRPEVAEADKRRLIWRAISTAAASETITAEVLKGALREQELAYLREPVRRYILATSLTIDRSVPLNATLVDGSRITFSRALPKRYSRAALRQDLDAHTKIDNADRLLSARISVNARTHAAAFEAAIEKLDYWRALINYQLNVRSAMRRTYGDMRAVNQILLGPIHTLHFPGGRLAHDSFWYEQFQQQTTKVADVRGQLPKLLRTAKTLKGRLRRCKYGDRLRLLFVRYTRALDHVDYSLAYNALWAVFEHLAGAVGDYKHLIDRVVFLYDSAESTYVRLLLEHLRDVRNGLVHESQTRSTMETYLYQLKSFVEDLFRFHLSTNNPFSSIAVATAFLDLPMDVAVLKERITLLRRAHRFRSPRPAV